MTPFITEEINQRQQHWQPFCSLLKETRGFLQMSKLSLLVPTWIRDEDKGGDVSADANVC